MDNSREPATKQDLADMESRLVERMRDMQTELLKAFLPFREQVQLRQSTLETRSRMSTTAKLPGVAVFTAATI
jgi:hypothetical protein